MAGDIEEVLLAFVPALVGVRECSRMANFSVTD
jgi:hypothetical protein